jgi:lipopolysaccharide transport system ATP-binding protein
MAERTWKIGMCGTFDVANYGDLLFPLIAEAELTERLGAVKLRLFSYHEKAPPDWPLEVESLTTLPEAIRDLDAMLIGGGHVIRFDKQIAPGYAPPAPGIHHPTGYCLTPALMALQHDVPLLWNAPGVHGKIPAWAHPLMKIVLAQSRYLSVRDLESRTALEPFANETPIAVVPDTAFRLPRLNLGGPPSAEFASLGIHSPYIVLQATAELQGFVRFLKNHRERFQDFQFLALPVSPVVGEENGLIDTDLPGVIRLRDWPGPLLLAELIGRSQAAVGYSYHLFITALTSGVPIFTHQDMSLGKYAGLQHFETIFKLPAEGEPDPDWFLARVGRTAPSASVLATCRPLAEHWIAWRRRYKPIHRRPRPSSIASGSLSQRYWRMQSLHWPPWRP